MRARPIAIAALVYSALAIAVTFPLIPHLTSVVPSDLGDPLLSTAILWWNAHVMPLTDRWWNGFAFSPATGMLAFSDHRLGLSLIASPLQRLGANPITAYNIVFLATFPLCALSGHALGWVLTKRLVRGALANPTDIWIAVPLDSAYGRFVRLRLNRGFDPMKLRFEYSLETGRAALSARTWALRVSGFFIDAIESGIQSVIEKTAF